MARPSLLVARPYNVPRPSWSWSSTVVRRPLLPPSRSGNLAPVHPITPRTEPDLWPRLLAGAREFDARRFWHAHERWEEAWRAWSAADRCVLLGLIQLAAVQHHLQRGRPSAARALLERDNLARHLAAADPARWPIDAAALHAVAEAQRAAFAAGGTPPVSALRLGPMLGEP